MANFPAYGYQPQQPAGWAQQPMYYQPQQPQQPQPEQMLYCRMVTSPEEARGVPVDFSGRPMTFLDLPHGRIYVKAFDAGSGSAIFRAFGLIEEPKEETQAPAEMRRTDEVTGRMQTIPGNEGGSSSPSPATAGTGAKFCQ